MNRKHILLLSILIGLFSLIAAFSFQSVQERKKEIDKEQTLLMEKESVEEPKKLMDQVFGKKLYKDNCESCHISKRHGHYKLDQMHEKLGDEYFSLFVRKEDSLLAIADEQTIHINESYGGNIYIHSFAFSALEMQQLMTYIRDTFRYK